MNTLQIATFILSVLCRQNCPEFGATVCVQKLLHAKMSSRLAGFECIFSNGLNRLLMSFCFQDKRDLSNAALWTACEALYWLLSMTSLKSQINSYLKKYLSVGKVPHYKCPPKILS